MVTSNSSNPNVIARIAGILYLSLIPLGIFGILYVPSNLIVPGDVAATIANISTHTVLFRFSIVSALLVQIINIAVVGYLYSLLKNVNQTHAKWMVLFILLGAPIAMLNELNQFAVLLVVNGSELMHPFSADQLYGMVPLFFNLHDHGINIAQIFWGLWLLPMGYLVFRSGYLPKLLGVLLMIGCFGYLLDSFLYFLVPGFGISFSEFTFIGELLLPLWLLIKGVNVQQWEARSLSVS